MNRHASAFRNAFLSLLLAIALPLLVLCAANVRHRQLQSKANPRWAAFAKVLGSQGDATATTTTASTIPEKPKAASGLAVRSVSHTKDLTGSATGSSPLEMPVAEPAVPKTTAAPAREAAAAPPVRRDNRLASSDVSAAVPLPDDDLAEPRPRVEVDRRPEIVFRKVDDSASKYELAARQLESKLAGIQQRLDQLTIAQLDKQVSDFDRAAQLLQQLQGGKPGNGQGSDLERAFQAIQQRSQATSAAAGQLPSANPAPAPARLTQPEQATPPAPAPNQAPSSIGSSGREGTIKIIQNDHATGDDDEKFSLQVHDAELTQVLDMLAQLAGVNILPSSDVQGRVSLNLQDVTVDRALEAILKSRGFVHEREQDFIYVRTAAEVAALKLQNRKLITKIYQPNYINAAELNKLITPILTKAIGQSSVTSPAQVGIAKTPENAGGDGLAQRDALLVQDYPEVIAEVDKIIIEMDVPPLQVIIEAKILKVRLSDGLEFGVNFAMLNSNQTQQVLSGNGQALNSTTGFPENPSLVPPAGDFIANTAGLKYGFIAGDISGFIKALENIADTSLVASPQIRVLNKQKAEMIIGDRISYKTLAFNGTQTVENVQFLDSGTRLIFRPFISPDGLVRLEVHPERSSAVINKETGLPNQATTEVTTNIMARDGTTVVLGGLIDEEVTESIDRVPILGAVPLIGAAFRNKTERTERNELIVLITPRIVTEPESSVEGECLKVETENRAANFRDNLTAVNRQNLTRGHYERAQAYYEQGNLLKARQQIDAALYQNKADLDSLRLKGQIEQATRDQQARAWKWPLGNNRAARR